MAQPRGRKRGADDFEGGAADARAADPALSYALQRSDDVLELDARELGAAGNDAWVERAAALFNLAHARTGVWPAAVHVRNITFPKAFGVLTCPRAWDQLADRCGEDTRVLVHDLCAARHRELHMPLSSWAALCRHRAAVQPAAGDGPGEPPPAPPGVPQAHWRALLGADGLRSTLYLSAFETQRHAPELATAFNALAGTVCMLRYVPGAHENVGPILMAAEAGASSGWHRDGTRVLDARFRGGDVNAFHAHVQGHKRWLLYPPRVTAAVAEALGKAPANAFGNLKMSAAVAEKLAQAGIRPVILDSHGGDVVLLGKHVWHTVDTLEASVSLAADRLLTDQLADLAATVQRFDGRPLMPAKWAVREAAASVSANFSRGGDGVVSDDAVTLQRSVLQGCAAFLEAQMAREPLVPSGPVFAAAPPPCVSCDRPHDRLRYCHGCGAEIFNVFFECTAEECAWEGCPGCAALAVSPAEAASRPSAECLHAEQRSHFLHQLPAANARMLKRVQLAVQRSTA